VKVAAIINPISGAGADRFTAERRVATLTEQLARRHLHATIGITERAGHARELAAAAVRDGADLVIVWGGDGTVNEAGAALLDSATALGLVPAGSGNGLAAALGCPRDPIAAIAAALDGSARSIDAGMIEGRPFFNIAGIGVDARIAALFNPRAQGSRGGWPYFAIGVREGCRYRAQEYDIELDGERRRVRALLVAFANGREYGMGARIAPGAKLDDGLLEAIVVEDRRILSRFWHARHLASGSVHRAPRVTTRPVSRGVVAGSAPIEYHVDGEPGLAGPRVEVTIRPGALKVKG
jgi:YegS/Rv2252/BmrU family lipid kinase